MKNSSSMQLNCKGVCHNIHEMLFDNVYMLSTCHCDDPPDSQITTFNMLPFLHFKFDVKCDDDCDKCSRKRNKLALYIMTCTWVITHIRAQHVFSSPGHDIQILTFWILTMMMVFVYLFPDFSLFFSGRWCFWCSVVFFMVV